MTKDVIPIHCNFSTEALLYLAYMPFVKGGGLFVRTKNGYELGSNVMLSVQLLNEPDSYLVEGKVVWITPKGAQGNKPAGIGVQFTGENSRHFCNKIETYLAGMLKSTQITDTI
jgi:type IV pilus assembly protein PilZ